MKPLACILGRHDQYLTGRSRTALMHVSLEVACRRCDKTWQMSDYGSTPAPLRKGEILLDSAGKFWDDSIEQDEAGGNDGE